jgi:hypothetical protein
VLRSSYVFAVGFSVAPFEGKLHTTALDMPHVRAVRRVCDFCGRSKRGMPQLLIIDAPPSIAAENLNLTEGAEYMTNLAGGAGR